MKKILSLAVVLVIVMSFAAGAAGATAQASNTQPNTVVFVYGSSAYTVDGVRRTGLQTPPFGRDGRTYMEVEEICRILGVSDTQFPTPDGGVLVVGGKAHIPIRFLAEGLGYEVSWNQARQEVTFTKEVPHDTITVPASTPQANRPVRAEHTPDGSIWSVQSTHWMVVNAWTPNVENNRVFKYLVKLSRASDTYSFGVNAGGEVWFFHSEQEARIAYDNNVNLPGSGQPANAGSGTVSTPDRAPTAGSPIRIDHAPNGAAWAIQSEYWAVANSWTPNQNSNREYKHLIEPGTRNMGVNAGGVVWFFASEQEARDAYSTNSLPAGR